MHGLQVTESERPDFEKPYLYYRGLNNYLYYFGGSLLLLLWYNGPQN